MAQGEKVGSIYYDLDLDDKKFKAGVNSAEESTKKLKSSMDNADFDNLSKRATVSFGQIANGALAFVGVTSALDAVKNAIGGTIMMAADFEKSLNVLRSVTGATKDEMTLLQAKARELGADISLPGVSAADAAEAMTELGKAGLGVTDILGASKGVLSLAKAGNLEVADAAQIAANALNAFGMKGTEASRVADILSGGANGSSASVEGLSLALQQAAAGAARMKVPLNDTVTSLALFAQNGIAGSDAGTSLKTMLARLVPATDKASDAMKDLGLDFFDAKGNFVGMHSVATQLQDKLGKLSQEQRELAINTIFGSDASRAAGILAKEGAVGFDKMSAAVNKNNAATELAKAQNSGFKGALDALKSTLETVATDLGMKLLPPLTKIVNLASGNISVALAGLAGAITAIGVAAVVANPAIWTFVTGLLAASWPFAAIGIAGALLAGGLVYLQQKFDFVGDAIKNVKNAAKDVSDFFHNTFIPAVKDMKNEIVLLYQKGFEKLRDIVKDVKDKFNDAKKAIDKHKEAIKQTTGVITVIFLPALVKMGVQAVASAARAVASAAVMSASYTGSAIASGAAWTTMYIKNMALSAIWLAASAADAVKAAIAYSVNAFKAGAAWIGQFILMSARAVATSVVFTVQAAISGYAWVFQGMRVSAVWLVTVFPGLVAAAVRTSAVFVAQAFVASMAWIRQAVATSIAWLVAFPAMAARAVVTSVTFIASAIASGAAWVAQAVLTAARWVVAFGIMIAQTIAVKGAMIASAVASGIAWLIALGPLGLVIAAIAAVIAIVVALITNFGGLRDKALAVFGAIGGAVINGFGAAGGWLYDAGKSVIEGFKNGILDMIGAVKDAVARVGNAVTSKLKSVLGIHSPSRVFAGLGANVAQGFADGIEGNTGLVQDAIAGLSGAAMPTLPALNVGSGAAAGMNSTMAFANLAFNGDFHFADQNDISFFFNRLGRNVELTQQGLTATR